MIYFLMKIYRKILQEICSNKANIVKHYKNVDFYTFSKFYGSEENVVINVTEQNKSKTYTVCITDPSGCSLGNVIQNEVVFYYSFDILNSNASRLYILLNKLLSGNLNVIFEILKIIRNKQQKFKNIKKRAKKLINIAKNDNQFLESTMTKDLELCLKQ